MTNDKGQMTNDKGQMNNDKGQMNNDQLCNLLALFGFFVISTG
jgi:hypothetical protein